MFKRKKRVPEGVVLFGHAYIELGAVLKMIDAAGEGAIDAWQDFANEKLQDLLDNEDAEIDVRAFKARVNEQTRNMKAMLNSIKTTVKSVEETPAKPLFPMG